MGRDSIDKTHKRFCMLNQKTSSYIQGRSADAILIPMSFHQVKIKLNS